MDEESKKRHYPQTKGEEIANSITHGLGALLGIAGLVLLIAFSALYGDVWHVVSFTIFGSTLIILYSMSTLYHALTHKKAKEVFQVLDHAAIFILIAGTYTPYTLVTIRGWMGWTIFGLIWVLAVGGTVVETVFPKKYMKLTVVLYLLMGWFCLGAIKPIYSALPRNGFYLLVFGGICYSLGVIFYVMKRRKYAHTVFHIFVLAGSTAHFFSILLYVL